MSRARPKCVVSTLIGRARGLSGAISTTGGIRAS